MITIEINRSQTDAMVKRYNSRIRNLEPPLRGWGNWIVNQTNHQFDTESDPDGIPWAALAPSTLKEKRRLGYPDDILTRTGKMRKSIIAIADAKNALIAVDVPSALFHQEGTDKMPQRRILGLNARRREKLLKLIRVYIGGRVR